MSVPEADSPPAPITSTTCSRPWIPNWWVDPNILILCTLAIHQDHHLIEFKLSGSQIKGDVESKAIRLNTEGGDLMTKFIRRNHQLLMDNIDCGLLCKWTGKFPQMQNIYSLHTIMAKLFSQSSLNSPPNSVVRAEEFRQFVYLLLENYFEVGGKEETWQTCCVNSI